MSMFLATRTVSARGARRGVLTLAAAALIACPPADSEPRQRVLPAVAADTFGTLPLRVRALRVRAHRALVESSAAAVSVSQPAIIFTINDSGHEPVLFAIDTTGADRGAWRITGARNVDWEAAAFGPCGPDATADTGATNVAHCLYIGETGDNEGSHERGAIYRVAEPTAQTTGFVGTLAAERVTYRYADGPRDVEAMYVAPDGTVNLITKRPRRDAVGRLRPALIYAIPPLAWGAPDAVVAQRTDSLVIVPGSAPFRQVTDAALSPDSRFLAVRTYLQVYIFATDPATGAVRRAVPPTLCNIAGLDERQGEGIGWLGAARELVLTSEGRNELAHIVLCPLPAG
jgi:hypothetical protein